MKSPRSLNFYKSLIYQDVSSPSTPWAVKKNIADAIIQKQADYVLALKENHENLFKEVTAFFAQAESENFRGPAIKYWETTTKNHGRLEIRRYWVTDQLATFEHTKPWKDIRLIGMVEAERTVRGKTTIERRYY